jgi:hypothetical protein
MKIVFNNCRGGFDLSEQAIALFAKKKKLALFLVRGTETIMHRIYRKNFYYTKSKDNRLNDKDGLWHIDQIPRNDLDLVSVVEELGKLANTNYSRLSIVDIPDNVSYRIEQDDGQETVKF